MKVEVMLSGRLEDSARRAGELADVGVDGVFTFEGQHDVFFPLVLAARTAAARGLDLTTNVAIAFPRSPMHLANAAYDLHLLTGGRFRLGLGSQVKAQIERRFGATWSRPAARMREIVLAIKAILAAWEGEARLDFRGEFTTHTLMTPNFDPGPNPYGRPPVLVGALGPRMTEIAAEVSDGILVMPFNSARHLRERTVPAVDRGLAKGGRERGDVEIVCEAIVAMGETDQEIVAATNGVKGLLSFYGSTPAYKPVLDVEGWGDLQPELNAMSKRGEWREMSGLVDDAMVRTLAVVGTPAECAREIAARFGAIAERVCCYFPGYPASDERIARLVSEIRSATT
jgi:probable F420-dependent oxidoreductase